MTNRYLIIENDKKWPEAEYGASTWTVVYEPTTENLSHHESHAQALAAKRRYEAADKRRA